MSGRQAGSFKLAGKVSNAGLICRLLVEAVAKFLLGLMQHEQQLFVLGGNMCAILVHYGLHSLAYNPSATLAVMAICDRIWVMERVISRLLVSILGRMMISSPAWMV